MLPEKTLGWGTARSCIRELFEYGNARKAEIGADKVFDFSLGNPSVPAPPCVNEAIAQELTGDSVALHGYTSAPGNMSFRVKIAENMNRRFGTSLKADNIYVTCGAAAGLAICMKGLVHPGEEVMTIAPFFPEYRVFAEAVGAELVPVMPRAEDFQIDEDALRTAVSEKTRAIIVNSPNNPSGVVFTEESVKSICAVLQEAQEKYGREIYLVCDEPYRELVYDGKEVPCFMNYYDNTIICYSFSKSMSIPGERLGYLAVSPGMKDSGLVFASLAGAGRCYGYVNAPSLMQRVIEKCIDAETNVAPYVENRDILYSGLTKLGFSCIHPDGAFYLFMAAPGGDAGAFSEKAKQYELLLVPSDDFGMPGYVRLAYCVSKDMILRSMPQFEKLAKEVL